MVLWTTPISHFFLRLHSFQERLGEISTKKWTVDTGHLTLDFEGKVFFLFYKISLYPSHLYSKTNKQAVQWFRTANSRLKL